MTQRWLQSSIYPCIEFRQINVLIQCTEIKYYYSICKWCFILFYKKRWWQKSRLGPSPLISPRDFCAIPFSAHSTTINRSLNQNNSTKIKETIYWKKLKKVVVVGKWKDLQAVRGGRRFTGVRFRGGGEWRRRSSPDWLTLSPPSFHDPNLDSLSGDRRNSLFLCEFLRFLSCFVHVMFVLLVQWSMFFNVYVQNRC